MSTCELRNHCRSDPVQVQSTGGAPSLLPSKLLVCAVHCFYELPAIVPKCWAEAPIKIARMTLTIKLDGNWNSFQLANNTPPLSVTGSVIAPSARMAGAQPGGASIKTPVRCNVSRRWLPGSQPAEEKHCLGQVVVWDHESISTYDFPTLVSPPLGGATG